MNTFTIGAKVRRTGYPHVFCPIGYEATVTDIKGDILSYVDADGDPMSSAVDHWELIEAQGPVRTITRREVVPGVWSGVSVEAGYEPSRIGVSMVRVSMTSDQLKAAAAVLLELAGALEE